MFRAHATGALHSRTIDKKMAAAKNAKMNRFFLNSSIVASVKFVSMRPKPLNTGYTEVHRVKRAMRISFKTP